MPTERIVIAEFMDESAVRQLSIEFDTLYQPDLCERREELAALLADADALIVRNRTQVNAGLLDRQTRLQAVGRLGVGLENIDLVHCRGLGIEVIPAVGANAGAVAEYVVCTAMMMLRGDAYLSSREVARGAWPRARLVNGREIAGKTLGIVGLGSVGRATAALARAVGMRVCAHDPALDGKHEAWRDVARHADLDALLRASDAVSVHVPLLDATRGLIDARRLALMPRHAVLVNVARGGVVDEAALADALREGTIAGAAVDVFEDEPLPANSVFEGVPNLVLTPHIAGVTAESNTRVSFAIADAIAQRLRANR
ncbi:NAD(P)-dependent oxidoreductase [Bordetella bronchialis]|uniref:3-phosphoglycerate dehydrogenase n=1 Tax=Bordetella bronchialis TaxID=463025 RepID=A0A193FZC6_9BORD|nr:NAD(P)-dependent oxidoreductase [Bordetella bronchialis]ANN67266.1 3-phosphoglycerate dehydrogenase [Bordetella bronchialis]ANN72344.1 3-phosphoglycerate dehydrogenase [Bordetella bronchialis]